MLRHSLPSNESSLRKLILGSGQRSSRRPISERVSYLEGKICYYEGHKIEITTAKKKRDLAVQRIEELETKLSKAEADAKKRNEKPDEQLMQRT